MMQCKHTVHMRSIRQSTGILFSLALLLALVACGSTPSTQATSSATATPTIPQATPTPTFSTRTTSLLTYTGHTDGVVSLQWSTDGKSIVSCSDDDSVQMVGTPQRASNVGNIRHFSAIPIFLMSPYLLMASVSWRQAARALSGYLMPLMDIL